MKKFIIYFAPVLLGAFVGAIGFALMLVNAILRHQQGDSGLLIIWVAALVLLIAALRRPVQYIIAIYKQGSWK